MAKNATRHPRSSGWLSKPLADRSATERSAVSARPPRSSKLPAFVRERLEGRDNLQKILINTGWLFLDRILRLGFGLVVGVWIARYLGPDQYGLLNFSVAFVALFGAAAGLGLDGIVVRNIVQDRETAAETLGTAFVLKLGSGLLTASLTVGAVFLLTGDTLTRWLVAITAATLIFQPFDTIDFWFQSQVQSKYTVFARNAAFILLTALRVILIVSRMPLIAFAWAGLAEVAAAAPGLVFAYRRTGQSWRIWQTRIARARFLLRDSWPLILSGVVTMIYMRIDQVMLGEMVGNHEVGLYSAAVRLSEAWYFIPLALASSTLPSIVQARRISDSLFYERLRKLYGWMALLSYAVAIPATVLAGPIVNLLYGPDYARAAPMLAVLMWAGLFVSLGVARSSFLTAMNWTKVHFLTVLLGAIINVILNLILLPHYGGLGAAIASCVAYWFAAHGACFVYRPLFPTGRMLTRAIVFPRV